MALLYSQPRTPLFLWDLTVALNVSTQFSPSVVAEKAQAQSPTCRTDGSGPEIKNMESTDRAVSPPVLCSLPSLASLRSGTQAQGLCSPLLEPPMSQASAGWRLWILIRSWTPSSHVLVCIYFVHSPVLGPGVGTLGKRVVTSHCRGNMELRLSLS